MYVAAAAMNLQESSGYRDVYGSVSTMHCVKTLDCVYIYLRWQFQPSLLSRDVVGSSMMKRDRGPKK